MQLRRWAPRKQMRSFHGLPFVACAGRGDLTRCQCITARVQALLLALRLWPLMPQQLRGSCALLPHADVDDLPASGGGSHTTAYATSAQGAAAFFASSHLAKLLPVFRATSVAHPRLHTLWPTVLALLLPGFAPKRVSIGSSALTAVQEASIVSGPGSGQALDHTPDLHDNFMQAAGGKPSTQPARPGQLEGFWATVVEGDLFTSSNERKYLGFQLFTILLPHLRCAVSKVTCFDTS